MAHLVAPPHTLRVLEYDAVRDLLARYARTPLGRPRARMLAPSADAACIQRWLDETSEMRALLAFGNIPPLNDIRDVEATLASCRSRSSPFEPLTLRDIASTLQAAGDLARFLRAHAQRAPSLQAHASRIADFQTLTAEIQRCVEPDGSISDHASPDLLALRRRLRQLREHIHDRLKHLLDAPEYQDVFEERLIYLRNDRPVLAVKATHRRALPGVLVDKSNSGATVFIEPHAVTELTNEYDDARLEESREITRILWELTRAIAARQDEITAALEAVGWIDLTLAKALLSQALHMTAPTISNDGKACIRNARHPLLLEWALHGTQPCSWEEAAQVVVPLSLDLGTDFDVLVISGPNTGGKTVVLKTVGLLALMMQSGMHVPAAPGTCLPVYAPILADIGDEQNLAHHLSTFSSHVTNLIRFLELATPSALILLDELGTGTDPAEGAALAEAVLDTLRETRAHVLATTHLGAVTSYTARTPRVENAGMAFDLVTHQPTYRLIIGEPGTSHALATARRLGMPEHVLLRAQQAMDPAAHALQAALSRVHAARAAAEAREQLAAEAWHAARAAADAATARATAAEEAAADRIAQLVRDIRAILNDYRHTLTSAPEPHGTSARKLLARLEELLAGTPRAEQQRRFATSLRPGDRVYLPALHTFAVVQVVRPRRELVRVATDKFVLEVPFDQISERPAPPSRPARPRRHASPTPASPAPAPSEYRPAPSDAQIQSFLASLAPGATVYVPALRMQATVLRVEAASRTLVLRAQGLEITVPANKVRPARPTSQPSPNPDAERSA